MRTTCIVSNFNYADFVVEAIDGALRQTVPFDEIIVVDDGSSDDSLTTIKRNFDQHPLVQVVAKQHEGQLSCFNCGIARATGGIVFFLDADDVYDPRYVERALRIYGENPACDFLFCGRRLFGLQNEDELPFPRDLDLGHSLLSTVYQREWIGASTSCLSMRRDVLQKIFPLPFAEDWRVRADDCLVFGASLANARKRYVAELLVNYRVHERNCFRGRTASPAAVYRRRVAINRLFEHLERKLCYNVQRLAEFHHREFCTIDVPTLRQLFNYFRIGVQSNTSLFRRLKCLIEMTNHYLATRRGRAIAAKNDSPTTELAALSAQAHHPQPKAA